MQYNENYASSVTPSSKWGGKDDKGYVYKKSSYQYSSSGNNNASTYTSNPTIDKNIDQLDALLEDLKTERQITRDRDLLSTGVSYRTLDRERAEPAGTITKTTRVIRTTKQGGANQGLDDDRLDNFSTSDYSTLKSNGYSTLNSNAPYDDYQTGERSFGTTGNMYESKSKVYESNRTLENTEMVPQSMTTTTTSNLAKDLQNIALTDDILPLPGTKVTTTVRTYTYEVPAGSAGHAGPVVSNRLQQHNALNYNSTTHQSNVTSGIVQPQQPHPAANTPQTVVYNTESYSTINKNDERPVVSNQTYEIREHRETNTLRNHLAPQQPRSPVVGPTAGTTKIIYNTENVHTVPVPIVPEPNQYTRSPVHGPNILTGSPHSPLNGNLPPGSTTNRYYYKESSNSVNTIHGPGGPGILEPQHPTQIAPSTSAPRYPPSGDDYPPGYPNTSTVTYKYNSSTTNTRRGPDFGTPSPSTQLGPFPVDGLDYHPVGNGNPPQRVDDLMQSFNNADTTDRPELETPHRKREIETSVASPNQQQIPSINKVGKEVYYPPGHDTMLTKREEMSSGSAAGGRWAKGSGMYEYESGSKSKTTSKSGGAMVPVCLPLCCAMPCSIM